MAVGVEREREERRSILERDLCLNIPCTVFGDRGQFGGLILNRTQDSKLPFSYSELTGFLFRFESASCVRLCAICNYFYQAHLGTVVCTLKQTIVTHLATQRAFRETLRKSFGKSAEIAARPPAGQVTAHSADLRACMPSAGISYFCSVSTGYVLNGRKHSSSSIKW